MPKLRYLTGSGPTAKFKRAVPKHLRKFVEKTAWVERVSNLSSAELKRRAPLFAVETNQQIDVLERRLAKAASESSTPTISDDWDLSDNQARELAVGYFGSRQDEMLSSSFYVVDEDEEAFDDIALDVAAELREAELNKSGEWRYAEAAALRIMHEAGLLDALPERRSKDYRELSKFWVSKPGFRKLSDYLARADVELAQRRLTSLVNGSIAPISDELFDGYLEQQRKSSPPTSTTLKQLVDEFIEYQGHGVTRSRRDQYVIPGRAISECLGPTRNISELKPNDFKSVLELLPRIPAYVTRHYKNCSLEQASVAFEKENGEPANRHKEARKHLQVIKQMFEFAADQSWIETSPVERLKLKRSPARQSKSAASRETYEPYDIEDLRMLFSTPLYCGCLNDGNGVNRPGDQIIRRARYWAPIISLFTGMRLNEILQLETADVRNQEEGIWYISVNDEIVGAYEQGTYNKRLKTDNSHRDIPVHPFLLQIGFQKWVARRPVDGRLFPEAVLGGAEKLSDNFSKKYRSFAKAAGVYVPRRKVFHSFRNTFNDELRRVGVSGEIREALNGWQPQRAMDAKYGRGFPMTMLYKEIVKVTYDGSDLDHLVDHHLLLD